MLHISCLRARCKYKVLKVKHANKPQKTSKHPEEKKQRCLEKKKCTTKPMKKKWTETRGNVCDKSKKIGWMKCNICREKSSKNGINT